MQILSDNMMKLNPTEYQNKNPALIALNQIQQNIMQSNDIVQSSFANFKNEDSHSSIITSNDHESTFDKIIKQQQLSLFASGAVAAGAPRVSNS